MKLPYTSDNNNVQKSNSSKINKVVNSACAGMNLNSLEGAPYWYYICTFYEITLQVRQESCPKVKITKPK